MDSEEAIQQDFLEGDLKFSDAIARLEGIGCDPEEARRMVNEWAEGAEEDSASP